jgi:hypothetical protein
LDSAEGGMSAAVPPRAVEVPRPSGRRVRAWQDKLDALEAFRAREGHTDIGRQHWEGGHNLGSWLHNCRVRYRADQLSRQQIDDLETCGVSWRPYERAWQRNLAALKRFRNREGHLNVPRSHREGAVRLGIVAMNYASRQRRGDLDPERVRVLTELGFPFVPRWTRPDLATRTATWRAAR